MPTYQQRVDFSGAVVTLRWPDFKALLVSKNLAIQFITRTDSYAVFAMDGNIAYVCTLILASASTGFPFDADYNQTQNDADTVEFETTYRAPANRAVILTATSGVSGQAPAKGLGNFAPDPHNNPYQPNPDEIVSLYVDGEGQMMTRGAAMTDEGSVREDFTGTSLDIDLTGTVTFTNGSPVVTGSGSLFTQEITRDHYLKVKTDDYTRWVKVVRVPTDTDVLLEEPYQGATATGVAHKTRWVVTPTGTTPGTVAVGGSMVTLSSGTVADCGVQLGRGGDYLPMILTGRLSLSQRIANQVTHFGFRDDLADPSMYVELVLDGTDSSKVKFRSAWDRDEQLSTVELPTGLDTSQEILYKIDAAPDYCALTVNGVVVVKHDNHVPDAYADMCLCAGIFNSATVTNTEMVIDTIFFSNQDQLQIATTFVAPIPVINREDQHSLAGSLLTSATTLDQELLSYTVPAGRVCYLIGYRVDSSGSVSGTIKIGCGDLAEADSPGVVDGKLFRVFDLAAGDTATEDFANPRKLGVGGNTIRMTVTPTAALSNMWHGNIGFVLR